MLSIVTGKTTKIKRKRFSRRTAAKKTRPLSFTKGGKHKRKRQLSLQAREDINISDAGGTQRKNRLLTVDKKNKGYEQPQACTKSKREGKDSGKGRLVV